MQAGIYASPTPEGVVYYIQARHFGENKRFDTSIAPGLPSDAKYGRRLLKSGDVLLTAKGHEFFAVDWREQVEPAIASSTCIVLRVRDTGSLLPGFLSWYLNQPNTQQFFADRAKKTSMPSISMADIRELAIPVPPVDRQDTILKIQERRRIELSLRRQMDDLRETYINQLIHHSLNT